MNDKLILSGESSKNYITVSQQKETNKISISGEAVSSDLTIINNNAKYYTDKAEQYSKEAEQSAIESEKSADNSLNALNEIKSNEDLKKVSANEENINRVANDIENVNFVGNNIEGIVGLVESLENLGDTTNINIVASNVNGINTVANDIENINTVATNKENIKIIVDNTSNIQYVAENIEDIQTVEENKNIVQSQVAIAIEKANTSTEQAEISTNQANISIAQATISTTQATKSENNANLSYQYSQNAKDKADICIENASICEEQALISKTQANISTTQANNSLNYSKNAKTSEENALIYSNNAKLNADVCVEKASIVNEKTDIAIEKSNNSKIWAEGTDSEVQALGGVHSAKGWAEIGGSGSDIDLSNYATKEELNTKQDKLTAGANISIVGNVISATSSGGGTVNVQWGQITGDITQQADLLREVNNVYGAIESNSEAIEGVESGLQEVNNKIPTKVSQLTNDKGYLTEHQDISNLATKTELSQKADISSLSNFATKEELNGKQNALSVYVTEVSDKSLLPSWYVKYSNGWCEQGCCNVEYTTTEITVSYLFQYISEPTLIVRPHAEKYDTSNMTKRNFAYLEDTTGFKIRGGEKTWIDWLACGYIA